SAASSGTVIMAIAPERRFQRAAHDRNSIYRLPRRIMFRKLPRPAYRIAGRCDTIVAERQDASSYRCALLGRPPAQGQSAFMMASATAPGGSLMNSGRSLAALVHAFAPDPNRERSNSISGFCFSTRAAYSGGNLAATPRILSEPPGPFDLTAASAAGASTSAAFLYSSR